MAYKPEHAVGFDTGGVVTVEMHPADRGDTTTLPETLESAARHLAAVDVAPSAEAPAELVADKGYHSRDTLKALDDGPWGSAWVGTIPMPGSGLTAVLLLAVEDQIAVLVVSIQADPLD